MKTGSIVVENRSRGPITLEIPKEVIADGAKGAERYESFEWGDPADRGREDNPSPVLRFSVVKWDRICDHHQAAIASMIDNGELTVSKAY